MRAEVCDWSRSTFEVHQPGKVGFLIGQPSAGCRQGVGLTNMSSPNMFSLPFGPSDLKVFLEHETLGVKQFEGLLLEDRYMTVPDALYQTFGRLVKQVVRDDHSIQLDILQWVQKYESSRSFVLVSGKTSTVDQDLRTTTIAMLRAIYEFGPIPTNLYQVMELIAHSVDELRFSKMYTGYNDRGLVDTTRESTFRQYMSVGYKGTGIETVSLMSLFSDAELTCLLTLEDFTEETDLPEALPKQELYVKLRAAFEGVESCEQFLVKWRKFKGFFPKYRDEDDKLNRRLKMFVPPAGQNRINAAGRFGSVDEGDPTRFAAMQHWTMTFWRRMPRTATRYLSEENQIRDACEQTISDSELLMKAADTRASLFDWDTRHVRWSLLKADHQEQ